MYWGKVAIDLLFLALAASLVIAGHTAAGVIGMFVWVVITMAIDALKHQLYSYSCKEPTHHEDAP